MVKHLNLNVLVLNNNFYGSYESNQVFFNELCIELQKIGVCVLRAKTCEEAIYLYENEKIDFSICFSKYFYFENKIPLYDVYKVPHYQWVSDNPIKMNLDVESRWIHYIFIDDEFSKVLKNLINKPLILPLGFRIDNRLSDREHKKNGILVPCKIRNLSEIESKIEAHPMCNLIKLFLNHYDYNTSFIEYYVAFEKEHKTNEEEFFRIVNEYTRVKKRVDVVKNIKNRDVYIVGRDYGNFKGQSNVHFINELSYEDIGKIMNEYKYVVNVDPNYHACIHDRFIKAVNSGSICITNQNSVITKEKPFVYSFEDLSNLDELFTYIDKQYSEIMKLEINIIEDYSWENSIYKIINDFLMFRGGKVCN